MQSLAKHNCGDCNLCCLLTAVPELAKPVRSWCHNCSADGCKIYEIRPPSCRSYHCLWLVNDWMGEELRPDKCGVIFEKLVDSTTFLLLVDPQRATAWRSPKVQNLCDRLIKERHALVAIIPDVCPQIRVPEGISQQAIINEISHAIARANAEMVKMNGSSSVHH